VEIPCGLAACESAACDPAFSLSVTPADVDRLRALVKDRNAPQKHVWRAQIVMLSAEGLGTNAIMRETGKSKTCVWRWQERFAAEGVDGLPIALELWRHSRLTYSLAATSSETLSDPILRR
jgi:hypothetical protein